MPDGIVARYEPRLTPKYTRQNVLLDDFCEHSNALIEGG
jgi:hypothetical protein